MAVVVEMMNAAGQIVTVPDTTTPVQPPSDTAAASDAPPASERPDGDSAPPPPDAAVPASVPAATPPASAADDPDRDSEDPTAHDEDHEADIPRGVQRRIDRLVKQRSDLERKVAEGAAQYARELAELRGQLQVLTQQRQQAEAPPVSPQAPQAPSPEDFATDAEYYRALARFEAAEAVREARSTWEREQREHAAAAEQARHQQAMLEREAALRAQYVDYDQQLSTLWHKGMSPQVHQALMQHDLGPDLAYYLAQHPDELRRIAPLQPMPLMRELGKLETRLDAPPPPAGPPRGHVPVASSSSVGSPSEKPAPLTPVRSGGAGALGGFRADMSQAEFEAEWKRRGYAPPRLAR